MLNKLKKVTNASKNVIAFVNKHITQTIKGNQMHTQNSTVTNTVIHAKSVIPINKVHKENNTASNTGKKNHKKLFENVLKQIKTFNKVHKQDSIFDYDKCETDNANSLLHNHILYYFNKIKKIERTLSNHNKYILTSLNKKYSNNRVKSSEFKKVNDKLNLLLQGICLFMFNKKIKKESIVENVNVLNNIAEHTAVIDNKRVCLGDIQEHLYENIKDIHDNIKNKKHEKVLADLLLIQKHTFKSINRMRKHNVNQKITSANKANKKSNKANKKSN